MKYKVETSKNNDKVTLTLKQENGNTLDKDQLQHLIDFVEEFKNCMDFQHITDLLKFVLLPLLQDKEKRNRFINVLEAARIQEENEIAERLQEDPEAFLSSIPHSGLDLIKNTLADFQTLDEQEKETLLKQFYRTPGILNMINTKTTNILFDPKYQEQITKPTEIVVGGKKKDIVVQTQLFLSLQDENGNGIQLPQTLTAYDRMVYDGICSVLIHNKDMLATNRQIYEAFAGKGTTSPQALGHVTRSLNKMRNTTIYLNCTPHIKTKNPEIENMVFDENLLSFSRLTIISGGQETTGYKFFKMPILYEYASCMNQIIAVDRTLLNIPTINNTDNNNLIKIYLLRRIETMKSKHNNIASNKIKFDSMIAYLDIQTNSKAEYARFRKTIKTILDYWKQGDYIKDYIEYKEGKKFAGIEIQF